MARERNWSREDEEREVAALRRSGAVDPDPFTLAVHRAYGAAQALAPPSVVEGMLDGIDPEASGRAFVMIRNDEIARANKRTRRSARG
ncbi:MAG: hypothetical protein ACHQ1G_00055 [Planctomycetota bacterium]